MFGFQINISLARIHGYSCRVNSAIQLVSHVFPPSAENACSQRQEVSVISEQIKRTKMLLPSKSSCEKNSPRPSAKLPISGGCKIPSALDAQYRLHCRDSGL